MTLTKKFSHRVAGHQHHGSRDQPKHHISGINMSAGNIADKVQGSLAGVVHVEKVAEVKGFIDVKKHVLAARCNQSEQ